MEWRTVAVTVIVVGLCFLAIPNWVQPSSEVEDARLFETYVDRYNKTYKHEPAEYNERFERFQRSLRHIEKMNGLRSTQESAYYGLTEFSDMSEDEFLSKALRSDLSMRGKKHLGAPYHRVHRTREAENRTKRSAEIPPKFDWRDRKVVSPVRSQGTCGACWAFSTVEVAESMFAIKNGSLHPFSVQEMIDCARNTNSGCEGGDICSLLTWLLSSKAVIVLEDNYPLTLKTGMCQLSKKKSAGVKISGFTCDSFVGAEDELLNTIATHGPVAVAVNALSWQNYLGGVIQYHCDGSFISLNHAVQIVGYDKTAAIPHYIIKNSWGPYFGDKGYIYVAIGSNLCGIANQASTLDVL